MPDVAIEPGLHIYIYQLSVEGEVYIYACMHAVYTCAESSTDTNASMLVSKQHLFPLIFQEGWIFETMQASVLKSVRVGM